MAGPVLRAFLAGAARGNHRRHAALVMMLEEERSAGDVSRALKVSLSTVLAWRRAAMRELKASIQGGLITIGELKDGDGDDDDGACGDGSG